MDRLERIAAMEEKLNSSLEAVRALDRALEDYSAALMSLSMWARTSLSMFSFSSTFSSRSKIFTAYQRCCSRSGNSGGCGP